MNFLNETRMHKIRWRAIRVHDGKEKYHRMPVYIVFIEHLDPGMIYKYLADDRWFGYFETSTSNQISWQIR